MEPNTWQNLNEIRICLVRYGLDYSLLDGVKVKIDIGHKRYLSHVTNDIDRAIQNNHGIGLIVAKEGRVIYVKFDRFHHRITQYNEWQVWVSEELYSKLFVEIFGNNNGT